MVGVLLSRFLRHVKPEYEEAMKKAPAFPVGLDFCDTYLLTAASTPSMHLHWRASFWLRRLGPE